MDSDNGSWDYILFSSFYGVDMKSWTNLDWVKITENFLNESYIKNMYSDEDLKHHFYYVQPYFYNGQVMHTFMGYLCGLNKIYLGSGENEPQKTASD